MDTSFKPQEIEEALYKKWEKHKLFEANVDPAKKPFSIILPPPNANADLHIGHAPYVYEDVMIRYRRLRGYATLFLPGADHAGIETQFVYEKHLKKQGKSRFDFSREQLFSDIWDFVMSNRHNMENQLRRMGFALDWSKKKFTMDPEIVEVVYNTFEEMFKEGLIYRAEKLVNYCTHCGTSYSDLEVVYKEKADPLYYMKYGPFTVATVRPETKFGDTAVAVHPDDPRYKKYVGQKIEVEGLIGVFTIKVVADSAVDPKFGTGVVKVTPAHDMNDWEIAKRHSLPLKQVIGFDGRLNELTGKYTGLTVHSARAQITADLETRGLMEKVDSNYSHRVGTCYRCGRTLEPLPKEQWFVKVSSLIKAATEWIDSEKVKVYPKRFKKQLILILENFIDWNISRQNVWGIRIPAYKCQSEKGENKWFVSVKPPKKCAICGKCEFEQDEDTFDTWFSSSQWPHATLKTQKDKKLYGYFYPTSVMETGYDILRAWVARMIMMGWFITRKPQFENIFLHGMVRDKHGAKISKSKGNVINPIEIIEKYGADALRATLLFGVAEGADVSLSEDKVRAMRNFANKVWNIGRFIKLYEVQDDKRKVKNEKEEKILNQLKTEFKDVKRKYIRHMDNYRFSKALDLTYQFIWHRFADYYIEELKEGLKSGNIMTYDSLVEVYKECLVLLHPFMPYVTDSVWGQLKGRDEFILSQSLLHEKNKQ